MVKDLEGLIYQRDMKAGLEGNSKQDTHLEDHTKLQKIIFIWQSNNESIQIMELFSKSFLWLSITKRSNTKVLLKKSFAEIFEAYMTQIHWVLNLCDDQFAQIVGNGMEVCYLTKLTSWQSTWSYLRSNGSQLLYLWHVKKYVSIHYITSRQTFIMYLISYCSIKDRKTKSKNLGHGRAIVSGRKDMRDYTINLSPIIK